VVEVGQVDKVSRASQPDQLFRVPPSLDEWLPQEHLARFVADLVDEHLDLSGFYAGYKGSGRAAVRSAVDGAGAAVGLHDRIRSSRKLEAGWDVVAFRWLAGGAGAGISGDREVP